MSSAGNAAVNGLELKTPSECGYSDTTLTGGYTVHTVLLQDGEPIRGFAKNGVVVFGENLVKLPAPKKIRAYKEGEVQPGWVFQHDCTKRRYLVLATYENSVSFIWSDKPTEIMFSRLLADFHRLTYTADGRELLGVAGKEE